MDLEVRLAHGLGGTEYEMAQIDIWDASAVLFLDLDNGYIGVFIL